MTIKYESNMRYTYNRLLRYLGFRNNFQPTGTGFHNFIFIVAFIFSVIYGAIGFYIVKPAEQAVITRLGKYNRVESQGPHWIFYFIENKKIVNTEKLEIGRASCRERV